MKQELENKLRQIGYFGKANLETILEALPNEIFKHHNGVKTMSSEMLFITKSSLFYGYEARLYWTKKEPDESLANCAARLLIKLIEEKIINLNGGKNEKTTKKNS
jgi:hypothetical protein